MRSSVEDLKNAVRIFLKAEGWSVNGLAAAAGLSTSTISKVHSPAWNPTAETLQACLDVVDQNSPQPRENVPSPQHNLLPASLIRRENNSFFANCLDAWNSADRQFGPILMHQLERIGATARLSAVRVGDDNRMRMVRYGPDAFGVEFDANGKLLSDMPDRRLFEWIEGRMWRVLGTGDPEFSSCIAPTQTIVGDFDVPYTALVLPCSTASDGILDAAVTITRLEPSEYRDKIAKIRPINSNQAA